MKRKLTLSVDGISCKHCVKTIGDSLGKLSGVVKFSADLKRKTVTVGYDGALTGPDEIVRTIGEAGYEAKAER